MNFHTLRTIREDEGKSLEVYEDTLGNLTVGVGHKVVKNDYLKKGNIISESRCAALFIMDLKHAQEGAIAIIGYGPTLDLHVLICMVFQMGEAGVRKFKKMLAALEKNDYAEAAREMLDSKWAREDTPARAQRLADAMRGTSL